MVETLKHLDFIIKHTGTTIRHYDNQPFKGVPLFCFGLLERLHATAKGLNLLLQKVESDSYLEYSAGLIIRTSLLDLLIVLRAYDLHCQNIESNKTFEETESSLTEYSNCVFADGLDNTFKYMEDLKSVGEITENELNNTYRNIAKKYATFIETYNEDGNRPKIKFKSTIGGNKLFKQLSTNPLLKTLAKNYDTYLFYSKYDHFGILSYEVIQQNIEEKLKRLHNAVKLIAFHNFIICSLLKDFLKEDFTMLQYKSLGEYIENNIFNVN